jgi:polar amino acid transport system substrate-binding protein/glutamate/aspartate transport system substrate-binding protein
MSKHRHVTLIALLVLLALSATSALASSTLERIRDRKAVVFAYRDHAPPFSFKDRAGRVAGYSIELCTRVAAAIQRKLQLADLRIEWIPVEADARIEAVASARADAECGTTTIALSRMERVDFSLPIFVDGATLALPARSPIARLADTGGRRIAVIAGTTTERSLVAALKVADVTATLVPIARLEEGAAAVRERRADAYAGDRTVLTRMLLDADDGAMTLLADDFSFEPYAIVVPRDDHEFRLVVNRALVDIYRRGEIDAVYQRWLAPLGRPSPLLNAMFYLSTLPE